MSRNIEITIESVIKEIEDWSNTSKGKQHIQRTHRELENSRRVLWEYMSSIPKSFRTNLWRRN